MTLRSENWRVYLTRLSIVILFCLAVHATVVSECGGGSTFKIWKPERMRLALVSGILIGIAAYELRPRPKGDPSDWWQEPSASDPTPQGGPTTASAEASCARTEASRRAGRHGDWNKKPFSFGREPLRDGFGVAAVAADWGSRSWDRAREMTHNFVPDPDVDYEYLRLVHDAARAGKSEAMVKLGEYARRRCADVECYYWLKLAKIYGAKDVDEMLDYCRRQWKVNGFNPEYENEYLFFTERQGVLGRAALRLDSDVDVVMARARLASMIENGDCEAQLILEHCGAAAARNPTP